MRCRNGEPHTHETVEESRTCWKPAPPVKQDARPAVEGMYVLDGAIYKVVKALYGSGQLYAKVLDTRTRRFEVARGMIRKLTQGNRMSPEAAAEFGHLYGMCIRCAAPLTDDDSIARGIGPVCATKI